MVWTPNLVQYLAKSVNNIAWISIEIKRFTCIDCTCLYLVPPGDKTPIERIYSIIWCLWIITRADLEFGWNGILVYTVWYTSAFLASTPHSNYRKDRSALTPKIYSFHGSSVVKRWNAVLEMKRQRFFTKLKSKVIDFPYLGQGLLQQNKKKLKMTFEQRWRDKSSVTIVGFDVILMSTCRPWYHGFAEGQLVGTKVFDGSRWPVTLVVSH